MDIIKLHVYQNKIRIALRDTKRFTLDQDDKIRVPSNRECMKDAVGDRSKGCG